MQENNSLTFSAVCLVLTLSIVAGGIMSSHYENEVMKFSHKLQKTGDIINDMEIAYNNVSQLYGEAMKASLDQHIQILTLQKSAEKTKRESDFQEFQIMVLKGALKEKQNDTKELKAKLHIQETETEKTITRLKAQFKEAIELAQWYKDKLGTKKNDN